MSYATAIQENGVGSIFFMSVSPKYLTNPSDWIFVSGTGATLVYKYYFPFGDISALMIDGTARTIVFVDSITDVSLALDNVFFDRITGYFYFRSGTTLYDKTTILTYSIKIATKEVNWHSDVLSSASEQINWRGILRNVPAVQSSVTEFAYGIMPSYSAQVTIANLEGEMFPNAHQTSFNNAPIDIHHCPGDLSVANTKLILRGIVNSFSIDDEKVDLSFIDQTYKMNNDFVTVKWASSTNDTYTSSDYPNLDPSRSGSAVRDVIGFVDGVIPVNVDYDAVGSTTTNRKYVVSNHQAGRTSITTASTPAHNATTIYLTTKPNELGLNIGDTFQINTSSGYKSGKILSVNNTTAPYYIASASLGATPVSGTLLLINDVAAVSLIKAGVAYELKYGEHYTSYTGAQNHRGFQLVNNVESLLGIAAPITPIDQITCRVYGGRPAGTVTIGAHSVPDSYRHQNQYGTITNGVIILYYVLRQLVYDETGGDPDSVIDTQAFIDLYPTTNEPIGIMFPESVGQDALSYKDVFSRIALSLLLKIFIDENGKWSISKFAPLGASTFTASDIEIKRGSVNSDYDYSDILSLCRVKYSSAELSQTGKPQPSLTRTASSNTANWLHGVSKSKSFSTYLIESDDADVLASRLRYIFGDRTNKTTLTLPLDHFEKTLSDVCEISRKRLPGYELDYDIDRTRKYAITATKKTQNTITLEMTDQKGIEDNSSSW